MSKGLINLELVEPSTLLKLEKSGHRLILFFSPWNFMIDSTMRNALITFS